jgi:S1-C subfamily serine protease
VQARFVVAATVLGALACGGRGHTAPTGPVVLTPKQIVAQSKPAIVRVESGGDRVGTGFIIDGAGVIATNLHVVVGSAEIRVRTLDGTVLIVDTIVAIDPNHDLALLAVHSARS